MPWVPVPVHACDNTSVQLQHLDASETRWRTLITGPDQTSCHQMPCANWSRAVGALVRPVPRQIQL